MPESEPLTDSPAGPVNRDRQAFQEMLARCFVEAQQREASLSTLVAGLDGFRLINDSLGAELGDSILDRFRDAVEEVAGCAYRVGGDVYAAFLPARDGQAAVSTAERLREAVSRTVQTPIGPTLVSLGIAAYPDSSLSCDELLYGAQAAMYWAKAGGGDRVGYWGELVACDNGWRRKNTVTDPVSALVATLERKTWAAAGQTGRSAWYAKRVARELGLSPADQDLIETGALLHDIGKLATPDEVLLKPGALTEEEKQQARNHPAVGRDILRRIPQLAPAADIVAHHHEHYDGSGYPDRLQGDQIPIGSRIILVSDAFDAMTTHRSYRSVMSLQMATRELERCGGQQFDPRVVAAFVQIVSRQGLNALHWSKGGSR